jgi:hypothetical protein
MQLWDQFKDCLCDDLHRYLAQQNVFNVTDDTIFDFGLHLIQNWLHHDDKTLDSVGLSKPHTNWEAVLPSMHPADQLLFDSAEQSQLLQANLPRLNIEQ